MSTTGRTVGLQTIFSFFLGLMVTAFLGVGVYTFHPPNESIQSEIREIEREEQLLMSARGAGEMNQEERTRASELSLQRTELQERLRESREAWGRTTSIALILMATLTMAISLVRADQLPVISNGLLLGGVFTMVYGVGWIIATDSSVSRFVTITVALGGTVGLGYVRFVRGRGAGDSSAGHALSGSSGAAGGSGNPDLERRLRALEARMDQASRALGPGPD